MRIKLIFGRALKSFPLSDSKKGAVAIEDCKLEKFIVYIMNLNLIVALVGSLSVLFNGVISFMILQYGCIIGGIMIISIIGGVFTPLQKLYTM